MMDLSSSAHLRGGMLEKSRGSLSSRSTGRISRDTSSFLSQSQSDLRSLTKDAWARDDQSLHSRGNGAGNSSTMTFGRQEILPSRSISFFRGRTLSGFDSSRSSAFLQTGSSFRNDQFFLPSVGILGGLSQARGPAFGGTLIGNYSGSSGLHSGFGVQRLITGPSFYGQSTASGFDGRFYHSASLSNLHQQIRGSSSNAAFQQASAGLAGNSEWSSRGVATSTETSQQAVGGEKENEAFTAVTCELPPKEAHSAELEVKDSVTSSADVNVISQQDDDQATGEDHGGGGQDEESQAGPPQFVSCSPCESTSQDAAASMQPEDPNHYI